MSYAKQFILETESKKPRDYSGLFYAIKPPNGNNPFAWTNLAASLLE
jgi:hypothetical protein